MSKNIDNEINALKAHIKETIDGFSEIATVYALIEVLIASCGDIEFIEEVFNEVVNRRPN